MADIRVIKIEDSADRVESGPLQIGEDDWPGIFIRGDQSLYLSHLIQKAADNLHMAGQEIEAMQLRGASRLLAACCNFNQHPAEDEAKG